jgi:uncharacterized protein YjdB
VVPGQNLLEARETSTTNAITISHAYVFYNNPGRFVLGIATPEGTTSVDYDLEPYKSGATFTSLVVGNYVTLSGFVTRMNGGAQGRSKILRVNAAPILVTTPNWIFDGFASVETVDMASGFKTFANALTTDDLGAMYTFSNVRFRSVGTASLNGDLYDYLNYNGLSVGKNEVGAGPNFFRIGFFRYGINPENFNTSVNYTLRVFLAGVSQNLPGSASGNDAINIRLTGYVEVIQSQDVLPTSITLSPSSATDIILNSTLTIGAIVAPDDARSKNITWTSSDPAIASVTSGGVVSGLALGTTTITATSDALMTVSASVSITVVPIPVTADGVEFKVGDQNLKVGQSVNSNAALKPAGYVGQGITYTSSDEAVAKVTTAGVIQAWGAGTATITAAATENLELTDTLTVTVTDVDTIASARIADPTTPVTVNGVITKILNGNELYIQNGADAIHVLGPSATFSTAGFLEGDYVQVSGPARNTDVPRRVGTSTVGTIVTIEKINFLTKPEVTPLIVTEETFNTTAIPTESMWRLIQMDGLFPVQPWSTITPGQFADRDFTLGSKTFKVRVSNFIPEDQVTPLNTLFDDFWKNDRVNFNGIVSYSSGSLILVSSGIKDFTHVVADSVPVTSINLVANQENKVIIGSPVQLVATVLPTNADDLSLTFVSSDLSIATVTSSGLVEGLTPGTVTITATSVFTPTITQTITLVIEDVPIAIEGVVIANIETTLEVGRQLTLTVNYLPTGFVGTGFTFTSNDNSLATVNVAGIVTGVALGNVIITVTSKDDATLNDTISLTIVANVPVTVFSTNFGTSGVNGYAAGNSSLFDSVSGTSVSVPKDRFQTAVSTNPPHAGRGAFGVFSPTGDLTHSTYSFITLDFTNTKDFNGNFTFEYSTWSATAATNIFTDLQNPALILEIKEEDGTWTTVSTLLLTAETLSSSEYKTANLTGAGNGLYRISYKITPKNGSNLKVTNTSYSITIDDLVIKDF